MIIMIGDEPKTYFLGVCVSVNTKKQGHQLFLILPTKLSVGVTLPSLVSFPDYDETHVCVCVCHPYTYILFQNEHCIFWLNTVIFDIRDIFFSYINT